RLSLLAFLVVLVTCGSRTQTPDGSDPYGQAGTSQGTAGAGTGTTGVGSGVGGSTSPNLCGGVTCPEGSNCCPACGICVSPEVPCPDCSGGAGGGFPGTGGTGFPGTGGVIYPGVGGYYPGVGGYFPGTGGGAGCNEPL